MTWIYIAAGIALYIKILVMPNLVAEGTEFAIVETIVQDSGVPQCGSGHYFS